MKPNGMWLGAAVGSVVGLAGCSGKVDPKKDCFREFVQEIVQTLQQWSWEQNREVGCDKNLHVEERVVHFSSLGGQELITATRDGELVDAIDIAQYYRPSLVYGMNRSNAPDRKDVADASIEATQFGVDCAMVDERIGGTERMSRGCRPVSPVFLCPAFDRMLPIHQTGYFGNTPVTGRTTIFKFGKVGKLVDKSKWMSK